MADSADQDPRKGEIGDMGPEEFRAAAHRVVDWMADYLADVDRFPVFAKVSPGDVRRKLSASPPESSEPIEEMLADFEDKILPGVTHWNHPGFMGYFAITGSGPGIIG